MRAVFLPVGEKLSNYNLVITATAKGAGFLANTTLTAQVRVGFTSRGVKLISFTGYIEENPLPSGHDG